MSEELNANIWEDQARRYLKDLEETMTERDDLRSRLADAQARAERAEGERGAAKDAIDEISDALPEAYTAHKHPDITGVSLLDDVRDLVRDFIKMKKSEAALCSALTRTHNSLLAAKHSLPDGVAKQMAEIAAQESGRALTPAPQGRTDGDVGYHVGVCMSCGSISRAKNLQSAPTRCWGCEGEMLWGKVPVKGALRDTAMDATAPEVKGDTL